MIATAVQFYDVVTFLHITAVVIGFGPTFAYGVFSMVAAGEGLRASLGVARGIVRWNQTGLTIGMVIILLTGLYLAGDGPWDFGDFFVSWGFVAIIALFGLAHGYFMPRERQVLAMLERESDAAGDRGTERSPELDKLDNQIAKVGGFAGLLVILTIYVMTAKPFL